MKNGKELYERIGRKETAAHRWNRLTDDERLAYIRLGQGVEAMVKLHHADHKELARYLFQYVNLKKEKNNGRV